MERRKPVIISHAYKYKMLFTTVSARQILVVLRLTWYILYTYFGRYVCTRSPIRREPTRKEADSHAANQNQLASKFESINKKSFHHLLFSLRVFSNVRPYVEVVDAKAFLEREHVINGWVGRRGMSGNNLYWIDIILTGRVREVKCGRHGTHL